MTIRRDSGHTVLIIGIVIIVAAILAVVGWLFWRNITGTASNATLVTSFEECKAAPGSVLQETSPETCRTADGKTFAGQIVTSEPAPQKQTYCSDAEKLCFEYPASWTITQLPSQNTEPGARADYLELRAPNDALVFVLESGIGGLGGTCPEANRTDVTVLQGTPIPAMTGFAGEYTIDTLHIARVAYEKDPGAFVASLYVTDTQQYTVPGTIQTCGLSFSQFIEGRHSVMSSDYDGAGAFTFGYSGRNGATYASLGDAKAAFSSDVYVEGAAILASLRYQ